MLRIRELRKQKNKLQKEMAQDLKIPPNTFNQYENGKREPDLATLARIAEYLGVSIDYLLGASSTPQPGATLDELIEAIGGQDAAEFPLIAVIGTVRAGYGGIAYEDFMGYEPADVRNADDCFYLRVKGDSMEPRIHEGDLALVRKQEDVDNGDLAVVIINGCEGTLKKILKNSNSVILQPFNSDYAPQVFTGEAINEIRIVGKVISTITKTSW
jgi:repressor LexA